MYIIKHLGNALVVTFLVRQMKNEFFLGSVPLLEQNTNTPIVKVVAMAAICLPSRTVDLNII